METMSHTSFDESRMFVGMTTFTGCDTHIMSGITKVSKRLIGWVGG